MDRTQRFVSRACSSSGTSARMLNLFSHMYRVNRLICQLLEWEKVLREQTKMKDGLQLSPCLSPTRTGLTVRQPGYRDLQSFAKREAEDLDEGMRVWSSKRRKSDAEGVGVKCGSADD
jgi:hypothetical protein